MDIPGLVDLQVNGYGGVDFSGEGLRSDDFADACRRLLNSGTSAFLPTVITSADEVYRQNLPILADAIERPEFRGRLLGVHIEGPFISPCDGARGAHTAAWVRPPDTDYLDTLIEWSRGTIKLITIAAELDGAAELARHAVSRGITVSLGHQMAGYEAVDELARAGATALTHLGNGAPATTPRHDNPIWAGLANDGLTAMLITDGHHLPAHLIKTFARVKGASRLIVTSDAAPLAGLPPGRYRTLGNDVVLDETGKLYNPHTGFLVGSSSTMIQCMNYLASLDLLSPADLIEVGYFNPLRLIGVDPQSVRSVANLSFDANTRKFVIEEGRNRL
ncbi:MAG: N-acetylglucosamine-6-phosphate deacetylase [Candidatus Hydrogenedentes bacterium]|nr:N-acetylglucosamine-6-phosphate deacetylase [Candidatus Hydrogenedentota bacterium]